LDDDDREETVERLSDDIYVVSFTPIVKGCLAVAGVNRSLRCFPETGMAAGTPWAGWKWMRSIKKRWPPNHQLCKFRRRLCWHTACFERYFFGL